MKSERRELAGLLAIAVVFAIACVFLGRWQYHRFQSKYDADHVVGHNYRAAPVAIGALLPGGGAPLRDAERWRSVRVVGSYDQAHQLLVRNRPFDGTYGYEVLVPFVPASDGTPLLVDRGWIPNGQTGQAPDSVPAPPSGPATVIAHLLPSEGPKAATLPAGQFASIDLREISSRSGVALLPAYAQQAGHGTQPAAGAGRRRVLGGQPVLCGAVGDVRYRRVVVSVRVSAPPGAPDGTGPSPFAACGSCAQRLTGARRPALKGRFIDHRHRQRFDRYQAYR